MALGILGRTNRAFPSVWLRLGLPRTSDELDSLVDAASRSAVPIDITSQPGLWGDKLKGEDRFLTFVGSSHFENSTDETHAANLVQADLIQTLSAIGHETIDVYFLRIRRAVEEFQINGVLEALESAKQEGHVRYLGLCCDGGPFAALSMWQFHDAFDLLQVPRNPLDHEAYDTLTPLARERRVGVLASKSLDWLGDSPFEREDLALEYLQQSSTEHPVQVTVRSSYEVRVALKAANTTFDQEQSSDLTEAIAFAGRSARAGEVGR